MRIEVLYFQDCPNYLPALACLKTVLAQEALSAEILEVEVKDASAAKELNFFGSPTIRINGLDIDPDSGLLPRGASNAGGTGVVCRPRK